jgi:type VI secretion system protein ImpJ
MGGVFPCRPVHVDHPFPWGVERVELNEALLASGRVQAQSLRLWLPDGTLIDTQSSDLSPEPREILPPNSGVRTA